MDGDQRANLRKHLGINSGQLVAIERALLAPLPVDVVGS